MVKQSPAEAGKHVSPRILVVDDDPSMLHQMQEMLVAEGFEVIVAAGGRQGLAAAQTQSFAAAIVDIFMPEMDGLETIKALRAIDPELPIVAISGALAEEAPGAPDFLAIATKLWGVGALRKPFRRHDLVQTVGRALSTRDPSRHRCGPTAKPERGVPA